MTEAILGGSLGPSPEGEDRESSAKLVEGVHASPSVHGDTGDHADLG